MQSAPFSIDEYKAIKARLADVPELAARVLTATKPAREFPRSIGDVDLTRPCALVITVGVNDYVGALSPLLDDEGFELRLRKVNVVPLEDLAVIRASHEKRIASLRHLIGKTVWSANEDLWRVAVTPFVAIEGADRFLDPRAVLAGLGITERTPRGNPSPELVNFLPSVASADPLLMVAWAWHEHARAVAENASPWVSIEGVMSALEGQLSQAATSAANFGGESVGHFIGKWRALRAHLDEAAQLAAPVPATAPIEVTT